MTSSSSVCKVCPTRMWGSGWISTRITLGSGLNYALPIHGPITDLLLALDTMMIYHTSKEALLRVKLGECGDIFIL